MEDDLSAIRSAWPQPLTAAQNAKIRKRVAESFPALSSCGHDNYLALGKYLDGTPERFYSSDAYKAFAAFLEQEMSDNSERLVRLLNDQAGDIDRAILTLNGICSEDWHDKALESEEFAFMRLCDRHLNPAYLKLSEGVLHRFISIIASALRQNRGKSTNDLWKLSVCVDELNMASLQTLTKHSDSIVRNSIAHGRVGYSQHEVVYHDHKGKTRELSDATVVEMVDGVVDICNGCALALKLFYRRHIGIFRMPQQVMIEELQANTEAPWWHIEGCLVSHVARKSQLVIYARPTSRDYFKVHYMAVYSGILAENFAPGYDRYMVSLHSPMAYAGWSALDGKKLRQIRLQPGPRKMEEYRDVVEDNLVFYMPRIKQPKIVSKVETLVMSFRTHMPLEMENLRRKLGLVCIKARRSEIHRNGWMAVVNGAVLVDISSEDNPQEAIKKARKRILRAARRLACQQATRWNVARYLPTGYARIAVYQSDRRQRTLWGLSPDLVCTVQIKLIDRIRAPDISGSTIEKLGMYRIAWNKAWLDSFDSTNIP